MLSLDDLRFFSTVTSLPTLAAAARAVYPCGPMICIGNYCRGNRNRRP